MQQFLRSGLRPALATPAPAPQGPWTGLLRAGGLALGLLLSSQLSWAQTTKTLPGDYASFAAAFADLNTNGVPAGGVIINVAAGYTETPAAPLLLTATGTAAGGIVIQKAGAGANPKITAGVGTTTNLDAIIGLAGSDYVTFDGIDVAENAANTTATTQAEFGYALFRVSATDGAQNVSIRNAVITLVKANTATVGIMGANYTAASTTALTATSAAGANSGIKLNGNDITAFIGIYLTGNTATVANADAGNEIGTTAGNTLTNLGGANTNVYGIRAEYQNGLKIENNTVSLPTGNTSTTLRGIGTGVGTPTGMTGTLLLNNNNVTLASATTSAVWGINQAGTSALTSVTISNNKVQNCALTTTGTVYYIQDASTATALTSTITGNTVTGNSAATTSTVAGIFRSGATGTANITNNTVGTAASGNTVTAAGGTFYSIQATTGTITFTGNTIANNSFTSSGTGVVTMYGYYNFGSPTAETLTNNSITGLSITGSTATTHTLGGMYTNTTASAVKTISGNTIGNLTIGTSGGTAAGSVIGLIQALGTTVTICQNKIYGLTAYGAAGAANGMLLASGTTVTAVNNLVGSLSAPNATGLAAVNGVQVGGGTTANLYFNTIYLNAASTGATFGTSGLYLASTTTTLDARDNVVVNKSTAVGTGGYTAALRRLSGTEGTVPANLATTSNNNLYFAGTPSATNLIYVEGAATATNAKQTLADYKSFMTGREGSSVSEDAPFLSTTGTDATFLHINPAVATQIESGGVAITGITTDFDGQTRGTTPDIGADEGTFTPQDLSGPAISFMALTNTSSTANRTLTATITDVAGVATGANAPRIFYRKGTSGAFVSAAATSVSGNAYTFTLDYAALGGATNGNVIQYYVVAQDNLGNVSSSPAGGTFTTNPATVNQYTILNLLSGTYYVGTSTSPDPTRTYASLTAAAAAYNGNGLASAVTFLLLDPAYTTATGETFPIILGSNPDASATNTLTIKPNTGVTSAITGSNTTAILALNGADYVILDGSNGGTLSGTDPRPSRDVTVTNTSTGTSSFVILGTVPASGLDNATNNTVKNLSVVGSGSATTQLGIAFLTATASTAGNNNNVVQNNSVRAAQFGIYSAGVSATIKNSGTIITQNDMTGTGTASIGKGGIWVPGFEDGIQVTQNTVGNIVNAAGSFDVWGISVGLSGYSSSVFAGSEATNATISRNKVGIVQSGSTYSAVGIGLGSAASGTGTIANNFVSGVSSNGTGGDLGAGIFIGGGTGSTTRIAFNSVSMTGTQTGGSYPSIALAIGGASPVVEIRNNILLNTQSTGGNSVALGFAYSGTAGNYAGLTSSNNDFFVGTGSTFAVGLTGGLTPTATLRTTLAALNAETGQDAPATSLTVDPQFVSLTDLHAQALALNNAGVPVSGITVDIDGETRSATTPDIGADEFTPITTDLSPVALLTPTTSTATCFGTAETVSVSIRNTGATALNFASNPATVTVAVTPPGGGAVQTLTTNIATGTLAVGATLPVTLTGTLNLAVAGSYSFAITATVQGDGNTSNDVLTPAPTRTVINTVPTQSITAPAAACVNAPFTIAVTSSITAGQVSGTQAPALAIPDNSLTGASSTITLAGAPAAATISATSTVRVTLNITHSFDADLDIYLVGPGDAGTIELSTDNGSSGVNYTNTVLTTGATPSVTTGTAPFTSTYGPEGTTATAPGLASGTGSGTYVLPATALNGATINGDWKLYVYDDASGDTGTLVNWSLSVSDPSIPASVVTGPGTISAPTVSGGVSTYTVTGAPVGSNAYTVGTTSAAGCAATATQTVNVIALPTASLASATGQVCAGTSYQLAGTVGGSATGGTFTTSGTGTFSPDATTLTATYAPSAADIAAGSVVLTLTSTGPATCAVATATTTLTINPAAVATLTAGGPTTFCEGGSVTLTAPTVAGSTYQFLLNGTAITGATSATYVATTGGTYSVTVTATGGCSATSAATTVTVNPATSATFAYSGGTFCLSGTNPTPTITGTAGGTFASTTGLSINATTGTINLTASASGTYSITYSVGGTCPSTSSVSVTITTAPAASFSYAQPSYCAGGTTTVAPAFGTNSSGGTFTVSPVTGLTINASTGVITLATSTAGTYTVTNTIAASGGCAAATATTTVTINAAPVATLTAGGPTTFCQGGSVTFTAPAGTGNTYQFLLNGAAINGATAATYTASAAGGYSVSVTNASGCATTSTATAVVVNPTPTTPTLTTTTQPSGAVLLTSSAATGNQFYLNGVIIPGATAQTYLILSGAQNGSYTVVSTSASGCPSAPSTAVSVIVTASAKGNLAGVSALLFPNPTTDGNITLELRGYSKAAEVTVLNTLGQVVRTFSLHPEKTAQGATSATTVDFSELAVGVYVLRVSSPNTATQILKLVRR